MGRNVVWKSTEQLLDAYYKGEKPKQRIQSMYFTALKKGHTDRASFFKQVLDTIAENEKEGNQ